MATDAGASVAQATSFALQTHGLSKRFGNKFALDAVDLSVPSGSVTANRPRSGIVPAFETASWRDPLRGLIVPSMRSHTILARRSPNSLEG